MDTPEGHIAAHPRRMQLWQGNFLRGVRRARYTAAKYTPVALELESSTFLTGFATNLVVLEGIHELEGKTEGWIHIKERLGQLSQKWEPMNSRRSTGAITSVTVIAVMFSSLRLIARPQASSTSSTTVIYTLTFL